MVVTWDDDGNRIWRSEDAPALRRDRAVQLGVAAGGALLALARPAALGPGGRLAYRLGLGTLAAVGTLSALTRDPLPDVRTAAAGTFAAVAVALTVADAGEALDERLHVALERRRVRRPRAVLALGTLAAGLAALAADRLLGRAVTEDAEPAEPGEPESVPVPDEVRALASALLAVTELHGAPQLRSQLAAAQAMPIFGENLDAFYPGIGFAVPPDLPLAVPGSATLPVRGRLRALGDRTFDVELRIQEGRLETLYVVTGADWTTEEQLAWMEQDRDVAELGGWPTPDELTLLLETPRGLEPA